MSRSSLERYARRGGQSFLAQKIEEKNRLREQASVHRTGLTPGLLRLFEPRPLPQPLPPMKCKMPKPPKSGVAHLVEHFASPGDPEYEPPPPDTRPPSPRIFSNREYEHQVSVDVHTKLERAVYKAQEREREHAAALEEATASWDPNKDPNVEGDALKTLFVGRLSYDVTERKLRREFEEFGPVKRVRLVHDKNTGKPRGYAFIEYEHKSDMKDAYKAANGRNIEGRRCLVDVERGRSVPGWKPRRLGGGKGGESRSARLPKDPRKVVEKRLLARALGKEEAADVAGPSTAGFGAPDRGRGRSRSRSRERDAYTRGGRDRGDYSGGGGRRDREAYRDGYHGGSDHRRGDVRGSRRGDDRGRRDDRDRRYEKDRGRHEGRSRSYGGSRGGRERDRDGEEYRGRKRDRGADGGGMNGDEEPRYVGGGYGGGGGGYGAAMGADEYGGGGGGGYGEYGGYNAVPPPGYVGNRVSGGGGSGNVMEDDEPEEGELGVEEPFAKRPRDA